MMIDLRNESLLSLTAAARLLPPARQGRPVHLSTILRWILDGVKTPSGKVRLEGFRAGGRWLTSTEALERFFAAQTPQLGDRPPLPRTPTAGRRASEAAGKELQRIGI